jgi:hypothetical protein
VSLLVLFSGPSGYPLDETFDGASGVPNPRWTVSTVGTATVELDANRLKMVLPANLDVGRAQLVDIIPSSGIVEYRASFTFTSGTNHSPAFNFRGDGNWVTNSNVEQNGLVLFAGVVLDEVKLLTTVASSSSQVGATVSLAIGATDTVHFHVITSGTTVYWMAWTNANPEPDWQVATDSNHSARTRLSLAVRNVTSSPVTAYWDDVAVNDVPDATGTLAETLGNVISTSVGASGASGTLARALANATGNATGTSTGGGTLAETLDPVVVQASGGHGVSGSLAETLANVTVAASGAASAIAGTVAVTLDAVETASPVTDESGAVITDESGNPILVRGAEGAHGIGGTLAETLDDVVGAASGVATSSVGSLAVTLDDVTSDTAGTHGVPGSLAETLDNVTSVAAGTVGATGTLAETLANVTSAADGTATPPGDTIAGNLAVTLDAVVAAAGGSSVAGAVTETLADLTSAADGTAGQATVTGTVAVTLAAIATTTSGFTGASGSLARTLEDATSISDGSSVVGTVAVTLQDVTSSATGAGAIIDFQAVTIKERFHVVSMREMQSN